MKKFLVLIALVLGSFSLYSQDQLTFGVKAAVGTSNVIDGSQGIGGKLAFGFGGLGKYKVNNSFTLQGEALISFKGAESGDEPPYKFNFTYLEIPILAKYTFGSSSIYAGPYLGIKLNGEVEYGGVSVSADGLESLDFGISGGYDIFFSKSIAGDIRINYGTASIVKDTDMKNLSLMFGLSYHF